MLILAHKGNSTVAPENTAPAFRLAAELPASRCDGVECDVHLSADGSFVLCHDETIDAASDGSGAIAELTLSQLRRFDFGAKWFPEFAGTKICSLEEMIGICRRMAVINIEIKQFAAEVDFDPYIRLGKILRAHNVDRRTLISCFDPVALSYIKGGAPHLKTAFLCKPSELTDTIDVAVSLGCAAVHPRYTDVTREYIESAHAVGLSVNVWTVDRPEDKARMTEWGVDAIITNIP